MHDLKEEHKLCSVCETEFADFNDLKSHLRLYHNLTLQRYFTKFFPKKDKFSGTPFVWKDYRDYYSKDFSSLGNIKKWIKSSSKEEVAEYFKDKINKDWPLTSALLQLSYLPNIEDLFSLYEDFNNGKDYSLEYKYVPYRNAPVLYDTREKKPLRVSNSVRATLKVGDYTDVDQNIYIERKAFGDFCSTICRGSERFQNEIDRANGKPFIILCEFAIERVWRSNTKYSYITPQYLIKSLKSLLAKNPNVQVLFADGRKEAARVVRFLLGSGTEVAKRDLQFDYDNGMI